MGKKSFLKCKILIKAHRFQMCNKKNLKKRWDTLLLFGGGWGFLKNGLWGGEGGLAKDGTCLI